MATIGERRPGVWEVRGYTGLDTKGKPTQVSRTAHGQGLTRWGIPWPRTRAHAVGVWSIDEGLGVEGPD